MMSMLKELRREQEKWRKLAKLEGHIGNVVKEAQYLGTASGIQIAISMLEDEALQSHIDTVEQD